jgi:hypothetical protein
MDRTPRRRVIAGVAGIAVAAMLLVIAACTGSGGPTSVSLAELSAQQERFDGETVEVSGEVFEITEGYDAPYFVLQDGVPNRVLLLPTEAAVEFDGEPACVVGEFRFEEGVGRTLRIERIEAATPNAGCADE